MEPDADARAYDELSNHARIADLARVAASVMKAAAERGRSGGHPDEVERLAAQKNLSRDDARTAFGNALDVLVRGPAGEGERSLGRALAAHALASDPSWTADQDRLARTLLWLGAHTPFDATGLLDRAIGESAPAVRRAFAEHIRGVDSGKRPPDLGEALVGAAALCAADAPDASKLASALAAEVRDPRLARLLGAAERPSSVDPLVGEWTPSPRSSVTATLLGVTGASALIHASRILGRLALAYRRPAEVSLAQDGSLRIKWRVELLGRTLCDRDVLLPPSGLARAVREAKYPRLALYSALLALAAGSYFGVRALADGVRASSPSLVATGLIVVAAGIALDLALSSIAPGVRGRCRVLFVPLGGAPLCVGAVDAASADAMFARLAETLTRRLAPAAATQRPSDSMRSPSTASSRPADA